MIERQREREMRWDDLHTENKREREKKKILVNEYNNNNSMMKTAAVEPTKLKPL